MQVSRLFEIVYILLDKKITTAKELAGHFEVSTRTIYRDIDILSSAGIPIYASQGKGGGISLMENYVLNKSILSEAEQNEILFALQSLTAAQNPETDRVLSKLSSLFHKNAVNWIEVDLAPWGSSKKKTAEFTVLKNAILNHQVIEFHYFSSSGEKTWRQVEPAKLVFKVNAWYLQGFCLSRNEYRTFKISRMSDIGATPNSFPVRVPQGLHEDEPEESAQKWVNLQLRISPHGAYRVFDEFSEKQITKHEDGSYMIDTSMPESEWLVHYILSFGADLEVLSPEHIRGIIQARLVEMMGKYKN